MNIVEKKFESKATKRGGLLLFQKSIAIEFIEECKKSNIGVLGVDAFILSENSTQPSLDNSIDYSHLQDKIDIYQKVFDFLMSQSDSLYFEIVCND